MVSSGNKPNNDCFQTGFLKTCRVCHCLDKQVSCSHVRSLKQTDQCFESVTEGAFKHTIFSGKLTRRLFSVVLYCDAILHRLVLFFKAVTRSVWSFLYSVTQKSIKSLSDWTDCETKVLLLIRVDEENGLKVISDVGVDLWIGS